MKLCASCQTKIADNAPPLCGECRRDRQQHTPAHNDRYLHRDLYDGKQWDDVRKRVMFRDPLCRCDDTSCSCNGACNELSQLVDHRVPAHEAIRQCREARNDDGSKVWPFNANVGFYLLANLRGLCRRCHAFKTNADMQHAGAWPSVVEAWRSWQIEQKKKQ